jgi:tetratricopeptide (TPR) repeat protein
MLFAEKRWDEAETELKAALKLFPNYADMDGPYLYLARIHKERGENELAAAALAQLGLLNESALEAYTVEADIRERMGDFAGAANALAKTLLVHPYEIEVHGKLAELATKLNRFDEAVEERRAVVALKPVDKAAAHYRLAKALVAAGKRDEARKEVLAALEIAPSYQEAQDLLLDLRSAPSGNR